MKALKALLLLSIITLTSLKEEEKTKEWYPWN